jgi:hypothetical protein
VPIYEIHYLTRATETIEADEMIDDGVSIIFRRSLPDATYESLMRVRANAVDHIETLEPTAEEESSEEGP